MNNNSLDQLRDIVKEYIPDYIEVVKYGIPTILYKGKNLIHFAEYKDHIGIYPGSEAIEVFKNDLKDFSTSKGTFRIPKDRPLPLMLFRKLLKFGIKRIDSK
jgi:uncharacterized protein YdhG (YjbR/CyaY superfamily)